MIDRTRRALPAVLVPPALLLGLAGTDETDLSSRYREIIRTTAVNRLPAGRDRWDVVHLGSNAG